MALLPCPQSHEQAVAAAIAGGSDWGPYDHHVVLIDINTPNTVTDLGDVETEIVPDFYWDEPQPCISTDGTKVIFASRMGVANGNIRPVVVTTGVSPP